MDKEKIKKAVADIIQAIGEDPDRSGIKKTPERIAELYSDILSGRKENVADILSESHELEHDGMVILKDIPFYSMCEHHMLPFFGVCHIAYIPSGNRIIGLSKLARVVDELSRRLQIQERLTTEIADALMLHLKPKGAAVVIKARHLCMEMRGIKKPDAYTITSDVKGVFRRDLKTREEFLNLIK